jgi:tetratricopeptide (TPR) repeat protein
VAHPGPPPPDVTRGERIFARAESLEKDGRFAEAVAEYERVARVEKSTQGREPARALVRAAELRADRLNDPDGAAADCWRAIRTWPNAAPADDAVRVLKRLNPPGLRAELLVAARTLARTEVGDNLRFAAAELIEKDDPPRARAEYEAIARDYPQSGLRDDALFRAAKIARTACDPDGALENLRLITARQRDSLLIGSFNSALMDDAQLEAGHIRLEDKKDLQGAVRAWEKLRDEMPDSNLRDDAQMSIARAYADAGDTGHACEALTRLRKDFPESRYLHREAPTLGTRLGCK